jgi:hypothetical protein
MEYSRGSPTGPRRRIGGFPVLLDAYSGLAAPS